MPTQGTLREKRGSKKELSALHPDVTGAEQNTYVALESRRDMQNIYGLVHTGLILPFGPLMQL